MIIIFLDIDKVLFSGNTGGVEETMQAFAKYGSDSWTASKDIKAKVWVDFFDKTALQHLHAFIEHLEKVDTVGIVISSDWRRDRTVEQLKEIFKQHEFSKRIIGKTADEVVYLSFNNVKIHYAEAPSGRLKRGEEIEIWLYDNRSNFDIKGYFIFDDDNREEQLSELFPHAFIHCTDGVLSDTDYKKALELLENATLLKDNKNNKDYKENSDISPDLFHRAQILSYQVTHGTVAWDPLGPPVEKSIRLQEERRLAFLHQFLNMEWDTLFDQTGYLARKIDEKLERKKDETLADYLERRKNEPRDIKNKCIKLITEYAADPEKSSTIKDNISWDLASEKMKQS